MEPNPEQRRARREVLDNARRTVERALLAKEAADRLAEAAADLLAHADASNMSPAEVAALRGALESYRRAREV